jgi:lipopolysaccharide transport system ATP-binding protein
MNETAIRVENLSKRYRIGKAKQQHDTLRDALASTVRGSARRLSSTVRRPPPGSSPRQNDDHIWALRDVSFEVRRGEVVGIIGRNGAGKSTLLKILSRITEPTEGRAEIHGRVGSLLEVGTGFHPELTGRENIHLSGAILGMHRAEIDRKFDELVEFSGVERFLDTPVKRYSSGMYVRLAFAVAAHLEPEILLVDEVLAVGDAAFQKKALGKMGEVVYQGRTVLFVSHNMTAILNLCPNAMLMSAGRVALLASANRVVSEHLNSGQESNVFRPRAEERRGDQRVCIEGLTLLPYQPRTGAPLEFVLDVSRPGFDRTALPVELAITFLTDQGTKLFQIYSRHVDRVFSITGGCKQVVARVETLPLAPGDYWINLWAGAGSSVYDWLPECMLLSVLPGNLDSEGFVDNRGYPVVIKSTWHVEELRHSD